MNNYYLILAGSLGMAIAVLHGYLGGTRCVAPIQGLNPMAKRVLHAIMFLSALYWFVGGAVLAASVYYFQPSTQSLLALAVGLMYLTGAAANFWASRGRHFGWILLLAATGLIGLGSL